MILLDLFLTFLKIGTVSFGGGYGMMALIREEILLHGWMTEDEFLNMIAVAESTPGPIAVNMATFVGSCEAGLLGAFLATFGVVLPSFLIILLISIILKNILRYRMVEAALSGVRPTVIGLIMATGIMVFLSTCFDLTTIKDTVTVDIPSLIILLLLIVAAEISKHFFKKRISPMLMILFAASLGLFFYSFM